MCIIAYSESRKLTKKEFDNCWRSNSDGFGIAWRDNGKIHYLKGYEKKEDAWKVYQKIDILPHVAHFRITSTGKTLPELTHPFIVEKDSNLKLKYSGIDSVLFHNGTISDWERFGMSHFMDIGYIPEGEISDTRVAAMIVSKLGERALKFMSGKFVHFKLEESLLIGSFEEEKGVFFSNSGYKDSWGKISSYSFGKWDEDYFGNYWDCTGSKKEKEEHLSLKDMWELYNSEFIFYDAFAEETGNLDEVMYVSDLNNTWYTLQEWIEMINSEYNDEEIIIEEDTLEDDLCRQIETDRTPYNHNLCKCAEPVVLNDQMTGKKLCGECGKYITDECDYSAI